MNSFAVLNQHQLTILNEQEKNYTVRVRRSIDYSIPLCGQGDYRQ